MNNNLIKIKKQTLKKMQEFYEKYHADKPVKRIFNNDIDVIIYRRILVQKYFDEINVFDNSTDIYRPMSKEEIILLNKIKVDDFCDKLFIKNSIKRINNNRSYMQIGIAKKNEKQKNYHYRIAKQEIKTLRNFLDTNKKSSKFVNY
jgi:hypothetical protein